MKFNVTSTEIDWAWVEAHLRHPLQPEERHEIEVAVLLNETDALVNHADWLQRMDAIDQAQIAAAHALGQTHDQYLAALQGDLELLDATP